MFNIDEFKERSFSGHENLQNITWSYYNSANDDLLEKDFFSPVAHKISTGDLITDGNQTVSVVLVSPRTIVNSVDVSTQNYRNMGNGLVIQWGYASQPADVLFPVSFYNQCINVSITQEAPADSQPVLYMLSSDTPVTKDGFSVISVPTAYDTEATPYGFYWTAIGY